MMITENKNLKILLEVCDYTGYAVTFENNLIVCTDTYGSEQVMKYDNVECALVDWLHTLEEQTEESENMMWKNEIDYVREIKKKIEFKEFLYNNLSIDFYENTTDDGFGLSCEFAIKGYIKPLIHLGEKEHYFDKDEMVTDIYTEFNWGRIEKDVDTEEIKVWIFEPSLDGGGVFLHETNTLHYNSKELEQEIIKRWKEFSK